MLLIRRMCYLRKLVLTSRRAVRQVCSRSLLPTFRTPCCVSGLRLRELMGHLVRKREVMRLPHLTLRRSAAHLRKLVISVSFTASTTRLFSWLLLLALFVVYGGDFSLGALSSSTSSKSLVRPRALLVGLRAGIAGLCLID